MLLNICRNKAWYFALLVTFLTASVAAGAEKALIVFATISLKDVLTKLAPDFEKKTSQ